MFHVSMCTQQNQHEIINRTLLEFKRDRGHLTSDNIAAADDSSRSSNETFVAKT